MGTQQLYIKWNQHQADLIHAFNELLYTENMADVTLVCQGKKLKAHKIILSASSPLFQSLFLENPNQHPVIIMQDIKYLELKTIMDFIYRGEICIERNQLSDLLKTAETLQVRGLSEVEKENGRNEAAESKLTCSNFIESSKDVADKTNIFSSCQSMNKRKRKRKIKNTSGEFHNMEETPYKIRGTEFPIISQTTSTGNTSNSLLSFATEKIKTPILQNESEFINDVFYPECSITEGIAIEKEDENEKVSSSFLSKQGETARGNLNVSEALQEQLEIPRDMSLKPTTSAINGDENERDLPCNVIPSSFVQLENLTDMKNVLTYLGSPDESSENNLISKSLPDPRDSGLDDFSSMSTKHNKNQTSSMKAVISESGTTSVRQLMWEIFLKYKPMENPDLFEGDILTDNSAGESRTVVVSDANLWTDGIVPYAVDPASKINMKPVREAMSEIETNTCIKFIPRKKEENYIFIYKGKGCHSNVGMKGKRQKVSLGVGCFSKGIILHELCHALGFYHEHNRPDRDDYIEIIESNLLPNAKSQFKKYKPDGVRLLTDYSYNTVMHYGPTTFAKDKKSFTMIPKKEGSVLKEVYQKKSLDKNDIKYINILYKCE